MCISSILWSGFTKVYYFFPYSVTAAQGIPHDIATMHELWNCTTYRKQNKYLSTASLMDLVKDLPAGKDKEELEAKAKWEKETQEKARRRAKEEKSKQQEQEAVGSGEL